MPMKFVICHVNQKTTEVIREIEGDDRPYDPNLVCPRCGRQYRVGEIQKLKRHTLTNFALEKGNIVL